MPPDPSVDGGRRYARTAHKLILGSDKKQYAPFDRVNYQTDLDHSRWQFPETLLSMYYHPMYSEMSDEQKWRLSLAEAVNFFSFNIHGEQALVSALEPRLYRNRRVGEDPLSSRYLQRFIHEENSHTYMMSGYCTRYLGKVFANQNLAVASPSLSHEGEDLLFWGRIFILENFLGHVNRAASRADDVDRTARDIHQFHFEDEVRHKAWDKEMMLENLRCLSVADKKPEITTVRSLLDSYMDYIDSAMCAPISYRTAGLPDALALRGECLALTARQEALEAWKLPLKDLFADIGLH